MIGRVFSERSRACGERRGASETERNGRCGRAAHRASRDEEGVAADPSGSGDRTLQRGFRVGPGDRMLVTGRARVSCRLPQRHGALSRVLSYQHPRREHRRALRGPAPLHRRPDGALASRRRRRRADRPRRRRGREALRRAARRDPLALARQAPGAGGCLRGWSTGSIGAATSRAARRMPRQRPVPHRRRAARARRPGTCRARRRPIAPRRRAPLPVYRHARARRDPTVRGRPPRRNCCRRIR